MPTDVWRRPSRDRYLILPAALILFTAACGSPSTFKRPADIYSPTPTPYPSHYSSPYVDMFWRCQTPAAGGVSIDGYVATSLKQDLPPQNFQVTLSGRDATGQKLNERFAYGDNLIPDQFTPVPFEISLAGKAGAVRYDLYYSFYVIDERERLQQFGTVEDVCGARWLRKAAPPGS